MANLKIQKSFGRLGNFIIQVQNAIQVALFYKYNVILPNLSYLTTNYIEIIPTESKKTDVCITDAFDFYYANRIKNVDPQVFNLNFEKTIEILKTIFNFSKDSIKNPRELVIHIRSGDIFSPNPHPYYICPPISYYCNIIDSSEFTKIYLIAEDRLNPCINKLIQKYPQIEFTTQSLEKDIEIILNAEQIVCSYGTFIPSLGILSNSLKKMYIPSYMKKIMTPIAKFCIQEIVEINLEEYYSVQYPWRNTESQRSKMLTYESPNPPPPITAEETVL